MAKLQLFEYVVILHPIPNKDGEYKEDSELIVHDKLMAESEKAATFKIAREVPDKYADSFDRLEINIRAF